jgi:hypothetical protein
MKLILPISFLAITGILFFFIINPFYSEAKQIKADVVTYNLALTNSTELQKTRDSLLDKYKNIKKEDIDRLEHFLPSNIKNIELVLEIEKIANMHGMPVKNIRFDSSKIVTTPSQDVGSNNTVTAENDPAKELPYGIFPVDFVVDGDYNTFLAFLKDLELNLRLVDVKSIYFSVPPQTATTTGGTTSPVLYSYSFKINTYWLK